MKKIILLLFLGSAALLHAQSFVCGLELENPESVYSNFTPPEFYLQR
jgi:hypothetical protein